MMILCILLGWIAVALLCAWCNYRFFLRMPRTLGRR